VAIWHIDSSIADNGNETRKLVDLEEANQGAIGHSQLDDNETPNGSTIPKYKHYYGSDYKTFSASSTPSSAIYDGTATQFKAYIPTNTGNEINVTLSRELIKEFAVDTPVQNQKISGKFRVQGWCLDGNGVNKYDVLAYKPLFCNPNAGFYFDINTNDYTVGNHTIVVRETSNDGTITNSAPISVYMLPIMGYIDSPANNATIMDNFTVSGWSLSGAGVKSIAVYIDGKQVNSANIYNVSRTDVYNVYPAYSNYYSGFNASLEARYITNGSHTLQVFVTSNDNTTKYLPLINITMNSDKTAPVVQSLTATPGSIPQGGSYVATAVITDDRSSVDTVEFVVGKVGVPSSTYIPAAYIGNNTWQLTIKPGDYYSGTGEATLTARVYDKARNVVNLWMIQPSVKINVY
jgi:hypothetical protein